MHYTNQWSTILRTIDLLTDNLQYNLRNTILHTTNLCFTKLQALTYTLQTYELLSYGLPKLQTTNL